MENKAAELVASSILGEDFKTVILGKQAYTVYPETIKIICRVIKEWSKLPFEENGRRVVSIISQIPANAPIILRGLSHYVVGDVKGARYKAYKLYRKWMKGTPAVTPKEMNEATEVIIKLMGASDFFDCATSCKKTTELVAKQKVA